MKKEIDAIRAKDIAQGGLTQGQQTQIARNEQRISQVCITTWMEYYLTFISCSPFVFFLFYVEESFQRSVFSP